MTEESILAWDIAVGNFIDILGHLEVVQGVVPDPEHPGKFLILHSEKCLVGMPENVNFGCYGIELTEDWIACLGLSDEELPGCIRYVHQAQNYIRLFYGRNPVVDYDKLNYIFINY